MEGPTAEQVAQRAFKLELLDERQLEQVWAELGSRNVPLDHFMQLLLRQEYLTNYQAERLVNGNKSGFFFGDYRALYFMGSGTFARVYRAVHKETGQIVAVKVLRKRYSDNPVQFGQFVREGELGCSLRHPNIVPIFEVYSQGMMHFLVMEFIEGHNLREFVRIRGKIEQSEATRLMMDVVSGLRYAFEHGLTHRDLKLNNVLVSSRGQAKLADFGLATVDHALIDDVNTEIPNTRTIDYAGLERMTGVRKDDTRSDIFFLGCIYYSMLTGKPPLSETRDRAKRLSSQRFRNVASIRTVNPEVSNMVAAVVNKAMRLDVERRYQSPAEMLSDLESVARHLAGDANKDETDHQRLQRERLAIHLQNADVRGTVMVVESNARMQGIFREGLKRAGYRVLMTTDPQRALGRFQEDNEVADCLLFNAQELGEAVVSSFNLLEADEKLQSIPAILLLDEDQKAWSKQAKACEHRLILMMPTTMKQLRAGLAKAISSSQESSPGE